MKTPRARLAATTVILLGVLGAGCDDSGDSSTSGSANSEPVPSQGSTGSPFSFSMTGPDTAEDGQTITETLTNTGRLPDAYQVVIDPAGAATVKEPNYHLAPGESARVSITVQRTPFDVHLKSVGGGAPDVVALQVS